MSDNVKNNEVCETTTLVIKAIMALSQKVEESNAIEYSTIVKNVGVKLRKLIKVVDRLSGSFSLQEHKYYE